MSLRRLRSSDGVFEKKHVTPTGLDLEVTAKQLSFTLHLILHAPENVFLR